MDAAAELGRNAVIKHQIKPEYGDEQADAGQDCRTRLARTNSQARTETGKYSFSLFSWLRAGLATLPGWFILLLFVGIKTFHGIKRIPNASRIWSTGIIQYNIGLKRTVIILYYWYVCMYVWSSRIADSYGSTEWGCQSSSWSAEQGKMMLYTYINHLMQGHQKNKNKEHYQVYMYSTFWLNSSGLQ